MSKEWYLFGAGSISGFEEGNFDGDRYGFKQLIDSFMGKTVENFGDKITNTPFEHRAIIQNVSADTPSNADHRQILAEIGTLQCGQYIKFDNRFWLVISLVDNNRVYDKAVLWYCNYMMNFIPPGATEKVTYPTTVINATQYNSGVETTQKMQIGSAQKLVFVPYNTETVDVDHDFRLLIDRRIAKPTAYIVTQVDTEQFNYDGYGVLRWTLEEDTLRDTDDIANMVADNTPTTDSGDDDPGGGWL